MAEDTVTTNVMSQNELAKFVGETLFEGSKKFSS